MDRRFSTSVAHESIYKNGLWIYYACYVKH